MSQRLPASKGLGATSEAHVAQHEPGLPGSPGGGWSNGTQQNRTSASSRHT